MKSSSLLFFLLVMNRVWVTFKLWQEAKKTWKMSFEISKARVVISLWDFWHGRMCALSSMIRSEPSVSLEYCCMGCQGRLYRVHTVRSACPQSTVCDAHDCRVQINHAACPLQVTHVTAWPHSHTRVTAHNSTESLQPEGTRQKFLHPKPCMLYPFLTISLLNVQRP